MWEVTKCVSVLRMLKSIHDLIILLVVNKIYLLSSPSSTVRILLQYIIHHHLLLRLLTFGKTKGCAIYQLSKKNGNFPVHGTIGDF